MTRIVPFVLLAWFASAAGCASVASGVTTGILDKWFEPNPTSIKAKVKASPGLNPDLNDRPSSVVVRLYELTSLGAFEKADYFSLDANDEQLLSTDLQDREEFIIGPGDERTIEREVKPETRYMAVVAAYRQIQDARWRSTIALEENEENELVITLDNLAASIQLAED